jgi:hypothetical protein
VTIDDLTFVQFVAKSLRSRMQDSVHTSLLPTTTTTTTTNIHQWVTPSCALPCVGMFVLKVELVFKVMLSLGTRVLAFVSMTGVVVVVVFVEMRRGGAKQRPETRETHVKVGSTASAQLGE